MADDEVMADAQIAKLLAQSNNLLQSNGLNGGMNEDNMELTAEDMEDPELLAQLAEIGGMDDDDAMNVDNDDNGNSDDDGMFEEMKATTLHSLQQKIQTVTAKANHFKAVQDGANWMIAAQNLKSLQSIHSEIVQMEAIEFATEKDEIDAKLNQIDTKLSEITVSTVPTNSTSKTSKTQNPSTIPPQTASVQNTVNLVAVDDESEMTRNDLLKRYKMYKFAAKKAKDNKDIAAAKRYILGFKTIKKAIEDQGDGVTIWSSDIPPILEDDLWDIQTTKSNAKSNVKSNVKQKQSVPPTTAPSNSMPSNSVRSNPKISKPPNTVSVHAARSSTSSAHSAAATVTVTVIDEDTESKTVDDAEFATVQIVEERIKNYRIAAVRSKKAGDIERAKQYLRESKDMAKMVPFIKSGKIRPKMDDLPPALSQMLSNHSAPSTAPTAPTTAPTAPSTGSRNVPRTELVSKRKLSNTEKSAYLKLRNGLKKQISECRSDAGLLVNADDRKQREMLLKHSKEFEVMLQKVIQCEKQQLELPKYDFFEVKVSALCVDEEIQPNELRLTVGALSNFSNKGSADIFCKINAENLCSITTPTKRAKFGCDFGVEKRIKMERNKRLKNKFKFNKLRVSLFQKKLFGEHLMAEGMVKLKPLLEEAALRQSVELKTNNERSKKVADLEIAIRLRTPVLGEGRTVITRKWMKITQFPTVPVVQRPVAVAQKPLTQQSAVRPQSQSVTAKPTPSSTANPTASHKKQAASIVAAPPKQQKAMDLPKPLTPEMVEDPLSVELIESFECMTAEIERIQGEIQRRGGKQCEDLKDRMQALMTNKNVLEIQVSSGIIELPDYTKKIKKAMITDMVLAKYLNSQNRKQEAGLVFRRYKMMKKEIEGS